MIIRSLNGIMKFHYCFTSLFGTLLLILGSPLHAEEVFESQLQKLADDQYAVRMEAKQSLIKLCCNKPELIDTLIQLTLDPKADPEQAFLSKEIIRKAFEKAIFVERGALGYALSHDLIIVRLENDAPAKNAGIQLGSRLLSLDGRSLARTEPSEIYAMVHATRPGTKLEMELLNPDGEKVLCYPVVAPRSTVRPSENVEEYKKISYASWMQRKLREFENQLD